MAQNIISQAANIVELDHIGSQSVPAAIQLRIADAIWPPATAAGYKLSSLDPYLAYYTEQCNTACYILKDSIPFTKHQNLLDIVNDIKQGLTRTQVENNLDQRLPNIQPNAVFAKEEILGRTVDLAARLLLMIDVGNPVANRMWTRRTFQSWREGTIREFTTLTLPKQRQGHSSGIQLDADFNARNLHKIGGLKVELTNNLLDHLEVVEFRGETTVMIFHHASFLRNHIPGGDNSNQGSVFPEGFIHETLRTLDLLFPQNRWYRQSKVWYHGTLALGVPDADPAVLDGLGGYKQPGTTTTDIDSYHFWHDRLVRLKLVFDQAKPQTLRQWWYDRREGTQWYAVWAAVFLTVLFGLVQSLEGALQVYKAFKDG